MVLEAAGCGRRARVCLGRFILRHAVAATSSSLSFSACLPIRRVSNCKLATKSGALGWTGEQSGVAWKLKVLAIIDAGRRREPCFDHVHRLGHTLSELKKIGEWCLLQRTLAT